MKPPKAAPLWVEDKRGIWHAVDRKMERVGHQTFSRYWKCCGGGQLHGKSRYTEIPDFAVPVCEKCQIEVGTRVLAS